MGWEQADNGCEISVQFLRDEHIWVYLPLGHWCSTQDHSNFQSEQQHRVVGGPHLVIHLQHKQWHELIPLHH